MLSAFAVACLFNSCSSQSYETSRIPVSTSSSAGDSSLAGQILINVNSYRKQKGESELKRHTGLDRLAQQHCEYLSRSSGGDGLKINHNGFGGRAEKALFYFKIPSIAENVVSSSTHSASHVVDLWASSKSHEYNMRSSWTYTGIGTIVTSDGKLISTQIFGTEEQMETMKKVDPFARFQ